MFSCIYKSIKLSKIIFSAFSRAQVVLHALLLPCFVCLGFVFVSVVAFVSVFVSAPVSVSVSVFVSVSISVSGCSCICLCFYFALLSGVFGLWTLVRGSSAPVATARTTKI